MDGDDFMKRIAFLFTRKLLSQFPSYNGALPQAPQSGVAALLFARKLLSQFPSRNGCVAPKPPQSGVAALLLLFIIGLTACNRMEYIEEYVKCIIDEYENQEKKSINIRVAINTTGFTGLVHDSVTITSTSYFIVRDGTQVQTFPANYHFTINNNDVWESDYLHISTSHNHKLEISSIQRNWQNQRSPQYRGIIEITRHNANGGFIIVNELDLEEYLYAVVPSEMPTSHGLEAAKVQAVTARSFVYHLYNENRFHAFGAHVDDSVNSQVYNNIPETELSIIAVRATRGQVLMYDGAVVMANFFSTSGGTTANFGEVWARGSYFPSITPSFLRATSQFCLMGELPGDLRLEKYANAFFRDTNIRGFDSDFPWFRWQVQMSVNELSERINANISRITNPTMVTIIEGNSNSIGVLQNMEVVRRGQGGNIMEILLIGSDATVSIKTEFNIRMILAPLDIPVIRHDGSEVLGLALMPSAFFSIELEGEDPLQYITFFGGGNGHGVGMSQNGAKALINMGLSYREVLLHYYHGVEIGFIY